MGQSTPINQDVAKLLTAPRKGAPLSYATIAERVRKRHPGARTSPRSVASVASALRAAGIDVPDRRRTAH
jgi:hypothetical protein